MSEKEWPVVAGHLSLQTLIQELEKSGSSVQASIQDTKSPKGHGLVFGGLVVLELEFSRFFGFSVAWGGRPLLDLCVLETNSCKNIFRILTKLCIRVLS